MRKLLSSLALLFVALGVSAQSWTPVPSSQYNHETIVYADLTTNITEQEAVSEFEVAAFVGDECRAVGVVTYYQQTMESFFVFNVRGDLTADQGKEITFKAYHEATGAEYELTSSPVVMFDGESHISSSNRIKLSLTAATSFTMNDFSLNVGETVSLLDQLTVEPEGAQVPDNIIWKTYSNSVSVEGNNLTGVSAGGSWVDIYLGEVQDEYHITGAQCTVKMPATSIEIVTSEFTVNVGDDGELCAFMGNHSNSGNAYRLLPTEATEDVKWELKNDGVIVYQEGMNLPWTPVKGGTTQIRPYVEREGGNLYPANNQWITITVIQPVTEIQFSSSQLTTSTAMFSTAPRIANSITVLPEDATDKTYTLTSSDPSILQITYYDDGTFGVSALKAGNVTLTATANDGSGVTATMTVYVEDPATKATFANDPLIVTLNKTDEATDISQQIFGNISLNGNSMNPNCYISVADGGPVSGEGAITGNGPFGTFTAQSEGTSTVTVTLSYYDWDNYDGGDEIPWRSNTYSFEVQVKVDIPLESFDVAYQYDADGDGTLTLTPVPANATFNPSEIKLTISSSNTSENESWSPTYTLTSGSATPLTYTVHAYVPDSYGLYVEWYFDNGSQDIFEDDDVIVVPAELSFDSGWQWRSNPYGDINAQNVEEVFQGNKFYEARTQEDLLINDPSWGYFGTILSVGIPQAACYKLKMTSATTTPSLMYGGSISGDPLNANLQNGWTWVGSPYFYDRLLSNALPLDENDLPDGTVIISKSGGSAEVENGQWQGDLTVLKAGEGYIVYNPDDGNTLYFAQEFSMQPQNEGTSAPVKGQLREERVWEYDASQFMNNMTMVASLPEITDPENYSIGAFVDDECRGEGCVIDGKAFITVHTDGGEVVTMKLYNKQLGRFFNVGETFTTQTRLGSLKAPVQLHFAGGVPTDVPGVKALNGANGEVYDLSGRRVSGNQRGVQIQRMADGSVRKLLVK